MNEATSRSAAHGSLPVPPRISLLTDFGPKDTYVGVMKGVIATIAPQAVVEDLSHGVGPQDISEGAFLLANSYSFFPVGTIHVAVVDPGVGSERAILALEIDNYSFVAPDNGLLGGVLRGRTPDRVVRVEDRRYFLESVSATFQGRDVIAPVAAHLATGVDLGDLGPEHHDPLGIPWPAPRYESGRWYGVVIYCDHFGNCVTNLEAKGQPAGRVRLEASVDAPEVPVCHHYSEVETGELLVVRGSSGYLEISVRDGSAAALRGLARGSKVSWVPHP